jgi:hypothetical protein
MIIFFVLSSITNENKFMPVQVEYDPSRATIVDPKSGRNIQRYRKEPCEHPIRLTDKITLWAGSQALIPDDHWNEYINHPNPNVRNKIIPEQIRSGLLRVVTVLDVGDNPSSLITTVDTSRAVDLIEQTFDAVMLDTWEKEDDRPAVLNAIARQRADIKKEAGLDAKATAPANKPKPTAAQHKVGD